MSNEQRIERLLELARIHGASEGEIENYQKGLLELTSKQLGTELAKAEKAETERVARLESAKSDKARLARERQGLVPCRVLKPIVHAGRHYNTDEEVWLAPEIVQARPEHVEAL